MRKPIFNTTEMKPANDIFEGQSLEREIEDAETTKSPIEATRPIIFTPRKDGVRPEHNIRADRFELALKAMDKVSKSYRTQRADFIKSQEEKNKNTTTPIAEA